MQGFMKYTRYVILILLIGFTIFSAAADHTDETLESLPQITDKDTLLAAMEGPARTYAILDAPLSGTAVTDSLGILSDNYIYLDYSKEEYQFERRYNSGNEEYEYFYEWKPVESPPQLYAETYYVYGDIPLEFQSFSIEDPVRMKDASAMTLGGEQFFDETNYYYYPYGDDIGSDYYPGNEDGQIRYSIFMVEQETPAAFLASAGDGRIRSVQGDTDSLTLVVNGTLQKLSYYESEDVVSYLILAWIFGILLFFVLRFLEKSME